jgi:hypothetical protein
MEQKPNIQELQALSKFYVDSKYFSDITTSQVIVKILAGRELGIDTFSSVRGIHVIKGNTILSASMISQLVANSPRYGYKVLYSDDVKCEIQFFENNQKSGIASFTLEEAKRAELTSNPCWRKYPSDMLFARAMSRGAKRYAAGIFGATGVYTHEEMGMDVDEDGCIIDVKADRVTRNEAGALVNPSTPLLHELVMDVKACVEDARRKGACSDQLIQHIFAKEGIEDWPELKPARAKVWINYIQGRVKKFEDEEMLKEATKSIQETKDIIEGEFGNVEVLSVTQQEGV